MISTAEPQWIMVNNHALDYFGGVPTIVVCDNCKQAVTANKDWIDPDLNKDYAAWADHMQFAPSSGHWCVCQRPLGGAQRPPLLRFFDRLNDNNVVLRCPLHYSVG